MDSEIYSLKKHSKTRLLVYKFKFDYLNCPIDSNSALKITKGNTDFFICLVWAEKARTDTVVWLSEIVGGKRILHLHPTWKLKL